MKKKMIFILLIIIFIIGTILIVYMNNKNEVKKTENKNNNEIQKGESSMSSDVIYIKINESKLTINLENNSSVESLIEKLKQGDITINMEDYSNFEKVGNLGFDLPRNDKQINTDYGDVILYQGNKFVIYYDKNSWNFTKLGHIDISKSELKNILGENDIKATLSLE